MLGVSVFAAIGDLAVGARKRRDQEHRDFLAFFRSLVETLPSDVVELFGNMGGVKVRESGADHHYGIELTATDFMWWKQKIECSGARFVDGPVSVQTDMLNRLAKQAEAHRLSPDERKKLLAMLEHPSP